MSSKNEVAVSARAVDVLVPPDMERCQAMHRPGSFMTLGPRAWTRCEAKPDFLAVELVAGVDGQHGSMSLCLACAEVMLKDADLRKRVQLQPIMVSEARRHV